MKRYALIISFIAIGYILGWSSSVLRFGLASFGLHEGPSRPHGPDGLFEGLGLSETQKMALRKIRDEERDQEQDLRQKMESARRDFETLLDSVQDVSQLEKAFNRMTESKNALEKSHFAHMMKVHQILTPEQIKELGKRRPNRGPRGPRGDGPPPMEFDRPPHPPRGGDQGPPEDFPDGPPPRP